MSAREPMWYCHECNAEMRPLMVPDPQCASCHGSFVEKMENPADDPREFHQAAGPGMMGDDMPPEMGNFLLGLQNMLRNPSPHTRSPRSTSPRPTSPPRNDPFGPTVSSPTRNRTTQNGFHFEISQGRSGSGVRTFVLGGPNTLGRPPAPQRRRSSGDGVPNLSEYVRQSNSGPAGRNDVSGTLMAQYLMALLGGRPGMAGGMFGGPGSPGEEGRWGDYVFSQEALNQIMTQMMENADSHRPVPATDEVVEKLPREVLEQDSPLLQKDCAVCKEQFKTETDDPDEQIVITLPCKHPFHEPCILPWLKSSATCPVCRYALVPQPGQTEAGPQPGSPPGNSGSRPPRSPPPPSRSPPGGYPSDADHNSSSSGSSGGSNFLGSIFGLLGGHNASNSQSGNANAQGSNHGRRSSRDNGWHEQVD